MKAYVLNSSWHFFLYMCYLKPSLVYILANHAQLLLLVHVESSFQSPAHHQDSWTSHVPHAALHFFLATSCVKLKLGFPSQIRCPHLWCPPQPQQTSQIVWPWMSMVVITVSALATLHYNLLNVLLTHLAMCWSVMMAIMSYPSS